MILIESDTTYEVWRSLGRACNHYGWSYAYLKRQKFPFEYKSYTFTKSKIELY